MIKQTLLFIATALILTQVCSAS